jgi:uncharacterized surface protein with fasciclin (FAS1) repeats
VREAGLEGAVRTAGPSDGRTIFAPTNAALLEALDANDNGEIESGEIPGTAADILQYHVVNGAVRAGEVPTTETTLTTLEGSTLTVVRTVDDDAVTVTVNPADEAATVTTPDVVVDNGVIHGIDVVLTP